MCLCSPRYREHDNEGHASPNVQRSGSVPKGGDAVVHSAVDAGCLIDGSNTRLAMERVHPSELRLLSS